MNTENSNIQLTVINRDGISVPYNDVKIYNAVLSAATAVGHSNPDYVAQIIMSSVTEHFRNHEDEIQLTSIEQQVENFLIKFDFNDVAREYIQYRSRSSDKRDVRNAYAKMGLDLLDGSNTEAQRLNANVSRDNNMSKVEMVKREFNKKLALDYILPAKFSQWHFNNELYIHDIDCLVTKSHNCLLLDYPHMFHRPQGFMLGNKRIFNPTTIRVAMNVLVQIIQVQSNHQYGGLTAADIDVHMVEYVRGSYNKHIKSNTKKAVELGVDVTSQEQVDKITAMSMQDTRDEVYRAIKLFMYQLNTVSVRGESAPFTTITIGKGTSWESLLIQEMIFKERMDEFEISGVQIFPKIQFNIIEGVNAYPDDPQHWLLMQSIECSAKTCYPDYIFPVNQLMYNGGAYGYMGCRSLLSPWFNEDGKEISLGRANLGVVTLNLPRIAIESGKDFGKFLELLDERMDNVIEVLHWRYKRVTSMKASDMPFTYLSGCMGLEFDDNESVEKAFANGRGTLSVGYIGLAEVALHMLGESPNQSDSALELQEYIMYRMNARLMQEKTTTKLGFGLYGTPAESLTHTFAKKDFDEFGSIEGVTDHGYYVNSFHVDVTEDMSPTRKIDIEARLQRLSLGGHIQYIEQPSMVDNLPAYYGYVMYALKAGVLHFAINSPWDSCLKCKGRFEIKLNQDISEGYICPHCGNDDPKLLSMVRRQCGYLGSAATPPTLGRLLEINARVKHK